jgi:hypothetical protein
METTQRPPFLVPSLRHSQSSEFDTHQPTQPVCIDYLYLDCVLISFWRCNSGKEELIQMTAWYMRESNCETFEWGSTLMETNVPPANSPRTIHNDVESALSQINIMRGIMSTRIIWRKEEFHVGWNLANAAISQIVLNWYMRETISYGPTEDIS